MSRSRRKRHGTEDAVGLERWLLSYADFITLLMVFFIMMYALSKVDVAKYNAIAQSLSVVLTGNPLPSLESAGPSLAPGIAGQEDVSALGSDVDVYNQLQELERQIQDFISIDQLEGTNVAMGESTTHLADYIDVIEQERGLVISIKNTFLFPSGSDELNPQAREVIMQLGNFLITIPNQIRVEGHTDDLAINTTKFPSNWELSSARATTVLHILEEDAKIEGKRLSVGGYGEHKPLVENNDANSRSKNRRVDIVILKQKYSDH